MAQGLLISRTVTKPRQMLAAGLGGAVGSVFDVVTLDFSRRSRAEPELGTSLAAGVVGACTVLLPRVLLISVVLNQVVAAALLSYFVPLLLAGALMLGLLWPKGSAPPAKQDSVAQNPLRLGYAIKMAIAFQAAMILLDLVSRRWAASGVYTTAAFLGISDVDALAVSMTRLPGGLLPEMAARAITIGILANTVTKLGIAAVLGAGRYRLLAVTALVVLGALAAVLVGVL